MNYFEQNMECLKQNRMDLYHKLQDPDKYLSINKLVWIQSVPAKNEELFLIVQKEEKEYRLNSSYSPKQEAKKWVEQYTYKNMNSVMTMFGFGNGTFVREIIKSRGKGDVLFLYEPCPEIFIHVLNHYDIKDILIAKNVVLSIEGINEFEFHNLLQNVVNITNISSQIRCAHPYYEKIFPESGIKYWKEIIDNFIYAKMNINTEMFFGERFITNALFNARFIRESNRLQDLQTDFQTDVPAIIVAAGPSLKKNLEELKRAKGKAYIFVVDRILDFVLEEGLEPDFIVTIDPIKPVEFFTQRTDIKIPLLCELVSNWEVLDRHKGKKIIYGCNPYFQKMYESLGKKSPTITSGASVATAAFAVCVQLGFKRIVLVGQDLAYEGEFTHAGGIAEKVMNTKDVMVEGVNGNQVRSRSDWYQFLIWFKDMITLYPEIQVIDAKTQGAKIIGATVMPLKEVIDMYCTRKIEMDEVFQYKESTFNESDMVNVMKYFSDSYDELDLLKKKSKEAIKICEDQIRIYKRNDKETPTSEKNYKRISKINKFISEQSTYLLLETFITASSAQQISELYRFTDDNKTDKIATYEKSIRIFQTIIEGAEFVKPLLAEAIEHI